MQLVIQNIYCKTLSVVTQELAQMERLTEKVFKRISSNCTPNLNSDPKLNYNPIPNLTLILTLTHCRFVFLSNPNLFCWQRGRWG